MGLGAIRFIDWTFLGIDLYLRDMGENPSVSGVAGAGNFTTLDASGLTTLADDLVFSGANPEIRGGDTDGTLFIAPSTTNALGGNLVLYGDTHATKAKDIEFRETAGVELHYDASASKWDFQANAIDTTGGGSLTGTWTDLGSVTTVDINGGTVDGAVIGGAAAAAANFTTLGASGLTTLAAGLTFTGAQTITTTTGQLDIKTGAANGHIVLSPHGSGLVKILDTVGSAGLQIESSTGIKLNIDSDATRGTVGTSTAHGLRFLTGNTLAATFDTSQNLALEGSLTFTGAQTITTSTGDLTISTTAGNGAVLVSPHGTGSVDIKADGGQVGINSFRVPDNTGAFTGGTVGTWLGFSTYSSASTFAGAIGVTNSGTFKIQSSAAAGISIGTAGNLTCEGRVIVSATGAVASPSFTLDPAVGDESGFYMPATNVMGLITDRLERMRLDSLGNIGIGSTASPSANGTKIIFFGDNTADPTMGSNTAGVYGKNVTTTVELFGCDEAGNATQLTPHAKDGPAAIYNESPGVEAVLATSNIYLGTVRWVNLEDNTKSSIIETFLQYNTRRGLLAGDPEFKLAVRWDDNQDAQESKALVARGEWDAAYRDERKRGNLPSVLRRNDPKPLMDLADRPPLYTRKANPHGV